MPEQCDEYLDEAFGCWCDGQALSSSLSDHLAACPACAERYGQLCSLVTEARHATMSTPSPAQLQRIQGRVVRGIRAAQARRRLRLFIIPSFSLAAAAVIALFFLQPLHSPSQSSPVTIACQLGLAGTLEHHLATLTVSEQDQLAAQLERKFARSAAN